MLQGTPYLGNILTKYLHHITPYYHQHRQVFDYLDQGSNVAACRMAHLPVVYGMAHKSHHAGHVHSKGLGVTPFEGGLYGCGLEGDRLLMPDPFARGVLCPGL